MAIRSAGLAGHCMLAAACALGAGSPAVCRDAAGTARPGLATGRSAGVARVLAEALAHKDADRRRALVEALGRDGGAEALRALGTVLLKGDDAMRQVALDALIGAGDSGGADVLADFLMKGGWVWRKKVIAALRAWGSPKAVPALKIAAEDPEMAVRRAGQGALKSITRRIARAKEAAAQARIRAVAALIGGTDPQAEARLRAAMKDRDPRVRAMAALVLGRLKTTGATDILKGLRTDTGKGVRQAVAWAELRLTGGQVAEADADLAELLRKPVPRPQRAGRPTFAGAIRSCEKVCGSRIFVQWSWIEQMGVEAETPVAGFDGRSLAAALDSIVRSGGDPRLDWKAERGMVLVSTVTGLLGKRVHTIAVSMPKTDTTPQATRSVAARLALRSPRQDFADVPLKQCIAFVRQAANVDVFVRWGSPGVGTIMNSTKFTAHATDGSVADVLGLLLRNRPERPWRTPAAYAVVDGMVVISSPDDLAKWQQSRPEGLSVVEAMMVQEINDNGILHYGSRERDPVRAGCIGWLIDVDRPATAANVLAGLNPQWGEEVSTSGLFWAILAGRLKMVRAFLDAGADVNTPWLYIGSRKDAALVWSGRGTYPPLMLAAWLGNAEIVGRLIAAGANPNVTVETLGSPLHVAAGRGNYMAVAALIAGGADVATEWKGARVLHLAAEGGQDRIAALLIDKGARVNAPSPGGTPLWRAQGALRRAQAHLSKNPTGKDLAEARARVAGLLAVVKLLETHGAKAAAPTRRPRPASAAS